MMRLLILALAILIPVAIIFTQWQASRLRDFQKIAKTAEGQIVRAEEEEADPKTKRTQFVVEYEFSVDDVRYEGYEVVEFEALREQFTLGSRVDVLYDPANPKRNQLKLLMDKRIQQAG